MYLEELTTIDFRNLKNQTLKFANTVTVFYGDNAQGKTNLLEAIYLLSTGKSFRTRSDHELIAWGKEASRVAGKIGNLESEVTIHKDFKAFKVNKQPKRIVDIIGSFIALVFTPDDIEIISGAPDRRRRFLDQLGSNLDKKYLFQLVSFSKIIRSRNQLLFQIKQGKNIDLSVWDEQLAKAASFIWHSREDLIEKINTTLKLLGKKVTKTALILNYPNLFIKETQAKTESYYLERLKLAQSEDIRRGLTQIGPHRDDFKIIAEELKEDKVISKDLGIYGSRGEQRAASLALKLTEVALIEEQHKTKPTLLLDEVLGELDQEHRLLLLNQVRKVQTFITATDVKPIEAVLGKSFTEIKISAGKSIIS